MTSAGKSSRVRIVGCGQSLRCDDQVGLRIAEELERSPPPETSVAVSSAPGVDLLVDLEGVELMVIVDAAAADADFPPGTWRRIEFDLAMLSSGPSDLLRSGLSSHTPGVWDALALGHELAVLPPEVWIDVVAGSDFGYAEELTPAVEAAIPQVVQRLRTDVQAWLNRARLPGAPCSKPHGGDRA